MARPKTLAMSNTKTAATMMIIFFTAGLRIGAP